MSLPFPQAYLTNALRDGVQFSDMTLRHHPVAELVLLSGRLVACDPFAALKVEPFELSLPNGTFPVVLSVACIGADQRVAFATIRFRPTAPVAWAMLTMGDQNLATLKPGERFGYPVDAGLGCFMDAVTARLVEKRINADEDFFDIVMREMDKTYVDTWDWCNLRFDKGNFIAFSTGWGDGVYSTYAGRDVEGEVAVIVTDFGVAPDVDQSGNEVIPLKNPPSPSSSSSSKEDAPPRSLWQRLFGGSAGSEK